MKKKQLAFTLVELLVVMGIIAILVAVSLSAITGGIKSANASKCSSNMREIGTGFQSYLADNNNIMPQRRYFDSAPGLAAGYTSYFNLLAPYTGNNVTSKASVFVCPSHTACSYPVEPSYGMNWYYDNSSALTVTDQSTTIMVAETDGTDGTGSTRADMNLDDTTSTLATERHREVSNYLFFDGHIEKLEYDDTTNYWGTDMGNHNVQSPP